MYVPLLFMCAAATPLLDGVETPSGPAVLRVEPHAEQPRVVYLGWDTEGGDRARMSLLYAPIEPAFQIDGSWRLASELAVEMERRPGTETEYRLSLGQGAHIRWIITLDGASLHFAFTFSGEASARVERTRLVFPFNPRIAATTVLPAGWHGENQMTLPAIISAPDIGQMLLTCSPDPGVTGSLEGERAERHRVDFRLEWPVNMDGTVTLRLEPVHLSMPAGLTDERLWRAIRRGWFNLLQPSAQWGTPGRPQFAPPGLLANNVVSDPVSCVLHMASDHVLLVPELAPGISAHTMLRNTLDWWLDHGIEPNGEMRSWRQVTGMLDANAGPLIGAWCYVEASGDTVWLERRIEVLERLADYLAGRDIDGDGLVEAVHSGNYGTQIGRFGSSAYDTINSGHKDGYGNALVFRAWKGLAALERRLGRAGQAARYEQLAERLKAAYRDALFNPETGWLGWWRSEDGELHDLASPMITSIAIMYGLIELEDGRAMLNRLWDKMESAGFARFELGTPLTLVPVRKGQYMQPRPGARSRPHGSPEREDGTDTFQMYLNGGCCVSDAYYFITALHMTGEHEKADAILGAMLKRQVEGVFPNGGGFQNGVVDRYPDGAEFFDWEGNTCGYEGHLVYSFTFLQAALLRAPAVRERVLGLLHEAPGRN